jgi:hypothetical protein
MSPKGKGMFSKVMAVLSVIVGLMFLVVLVAFL